MFKVWYYIVVLNERDFVWYIKKYEYPCDSRDWKKYEYPCVSRDWKKYEYPCDSRDWKKRTRDYYSSFFIFNKINILTLTFQTFVV